jgi:hypothetical protein
VVQGAPPLYITRHGCDADDVATWGADEGPGLDESPVFLVGFPRSGTTLLEQALDAHPQLCSMDEQPFLQHALEAVIQQGVSYPSELGKLSRAQLDAVREQYWQRVRARIDLAGRRLLDKNPLNMLRLPLIRRLFPDARVLLAVRHPCDVVLSCYMQHFRAPEFALLCADLPTLAQGYARALEFWYSQADLLVPAIREVRYETMVGAFATEVRAVCDFVGLSLHPAMLDPAAHARARGFISTPSYAQVLQPVHDKSIGRWKAYEEHFTAALAILKPFLERWSCSS